MSWLLTWHICLQVDSNPRLLRPECPQLSLFQERPYYVWRHENARAVLVICCAREVGTRLASLFPVYLLLASSRLTRSDTTTRQSDRRPKCCLVSLFCDCHECKTIFRYYWVSRCSPTRSSQNSQGERPLADETFSVGYDHWTGLVNWHFLH